MVIGGWERGILRQNNDEDLASFFFKSPPNTG